MAGKTIANSLRSGWNWLTTRSPEKPASPETSGMAFNALELIAGTGIAAATSWGWGTACGVLLVGHAASNLLPALSKSTNISLADITAGFWKVMSPGTTFPDEKPQATFAEISTGMLIGGGVGALYSAATQSGWNPVFYGASLGGLGKVFTSRPVAETVTTARKTLRSAHTLAQTPAQTRSRATQLTFAPSADEFEVPNLDFNGSSSMASTASAKPASSIFNRTLTESLVCGIRKSSGLECGKTFTTIGKAYEHDKAELAAFYKRGANDPAIQEKAMQRTLTAAFQENSALMQADLSGLHHPEFTNTQLDRIVRQAIHDAQEDSSGEE